MVEKLVVGFLTTFNATFALFRLILCSLIVSGTTETQILFFRNSVSFINLHTFEYRGGPYSLIKTRREGISLLICPGYRLNWRKTQSSETFWSLLLFPNFDWLGTNFDVVGVKESKRSCTWASSCNQLLYSNKIGIQLDLLGDPIKAHHRCFVSSGNLLPSISKLLQESNSFEYPNCCKILTNADIVSAISIKDNMSLNLTSGKFWILARCEETKWWGWPIFRFSVFSFYWQLAWLFQQQVSLNGSFSHPS